MIDAFKDMEGADFSITIQKAIDPTKRPPPGLKNAISVQVVFQNAQKALIFNYTSTG
ncbi:MAG TPA: hypothetical protein VKM55_13305 [Candidatus Lokiarchaeia archaeon]|nr:hypothetical protein [Candidatus Lokiarchaeia archaeon]